MRAVLEDIGLRCEACRKKSYFLVHVEEARLVSSLLHSTWTKLVYFSFVSKWSVWQNPDQNQSELQ